MTNPVTRPTLLLQLKDKENFRAWQEFLQLYTPLVFGFCIKRGLNEQDAADVCQEVMGAVAGRIEQFSYDRSRGSFRSWLMTVSRNRLNSFFTRRYRQAPTTSSTTVMELISEQPTEEERSQWNEDYRRQMFEWAAAQVRGEFEPKSWEAFWQTALLDKSGHEVAAALGMSAGAVYIARSRVLARLKERVALAMKDFGLEPEY